MASYSRDLVTGLALLLDAADVGVWVPEGETPDPDDVAITVGWLPERGTYIALYAMPMRDDVTTETSSYAVRVRMRSAVEDDGAVATDDLADAVYEALHGLWSHTLSTGIYVESLTRSGLGDGSYDAAGRYTRVEPYAARASRPVRNHHR